MTRRTKPPAYAILLLLCFPAMLCATTNEWVRVAKHDLAFAEALASDGVRFGPDFSEQVISERIWKCKPRPSRIIGLSALQVREINLYCEDHCLPWNIAWSEAVSPCDRELFLPKWCLEGNELLAVEHFGFAPYFKTLTAAIEASTDPLVRQNLMAVIADRLDSDDLRDFPLSVTEPWVTAAASAYLERATLDDAIAIARMLSFTQFGPSPSLARVFEDFIGSSNKATQSQHSAARRVVRSLRGEIVEEEETSIVPVVPVTEYAKPQGEALEVTTAEKIELLVQRIDRYYDLNREKRYDESYALLASDYREKGNGRDEWIEGRKIMASTGRIIGWQVHTIQIAGTIAKVIMDLRISVKEGLFRWREMSDQRTVFWIFENANWYYTVESIHDWRDDQGVEVPVPTRSAK